MATSGTTTFTMSVDDIVSEAIDRCGGEQTTGYEARSAKRALGLFLLDLANRGINTWAIERTTLTLVAGTASYDLAADTVDMLDAVIRRDSVDIELERYSQAEYQRLATKAVAGRPTRFMVERLRAFPTVTFWPVPDRADTVHYRRTRRLQDVGSMTNELDVPIRYVPAVTSGLAWFLAEKRPQKVDAQRRSELKGRFDEDLRTAQEEDRERVSLFVRPGRRR